MDVEVTVNKLRKPATVYIFRIAVCSSLTVGVASVAKCWRQKPHISQLGSEHTEYANS